MGCNCGGKRTAATQAAWTVTYPNGSKVTKQTEVGARTAAAAVPGATYAKNS